MASILSYLSTVPEASQHLRTLESPIKNLTDGHFFGKKAFSEMHTIQNVIPLSKFSQVGTCIQNPYIETYALE